MPVHLAAEKAVSASKLHHQLQQQFSPLKFLFYFKHFYHIIAASKLCPLFLQPHSQRVFLCSFDKCTFTTRVNLLSCFFTSLCVYLVLLVNLSCSSCSSPNKQCQWRSRSRSVVLSFFLPPSIYTYPPFPFNHRQSWSLYTVKSFFSSFYRIGMEFRFFTFLLSLFFANFSFFTFGFLWCQFNYIQQENARLSNLSYGRTLSRTIMMMMNDGMAKKKQWSFCSPFHLFNFVDRKSVV